MRLLVLDLLQAEGRGCVTVCAVFAYVQHSEHQILPFLPQSDF